MKIVMINNGVVVNARDDRGNTALMYAKNEAKEEIVSLEGAVEILINQED
jgi:ankyrin repeat protein